MMDAVNPDKEPVVAGRREDWSFWQLLGGAVVLGVALYLSALALVILVPEQNNYALASNLKHDRLEALAGNRVVLVGGSNLAFGIDSKAIEARVGCPVVNMGMNGYFGVRFMLNEVEPQLRSGDVVVLAFEWDNYFKSVDGTAANLLVVAKTNPRALAALNWSQRWDIAANGVPYAARQKALRLVGDALSTGDMLLRGDRDDDDEDTFIYTIETLEGFNPEGDLESHLGVAWPFEFEEAIITDTIDPDVIPMIEKFVADMEARGVRVMLSYTPLMRAAYDQNSGALAAVDQRLQDVLPGRVPSRPQDYVYDEDLFFDTVYHLDAQGRQERSARLASDIVRGKPSTCGGAAS